MHVRGELSRTVSSSRAALWSSVSGMATPLRHSTARESPVACMHTMLTISQPPIQQMQASHHPQGTSQVHCTSLPRITAGRPASLWHTNQQKGCDVGVSAAAHRRHGLVGTDPAPLACFQASLSDVVLSRISTLSLAHVAMWAPQLERPFRSLARLNSSGATHGAACQQRGA